MCAIFDKNLTINNYSCIIKIQTLIKTEYIKQPIQPRLVTTEKKQVKNEEPTKSKNVSVRSNSFQLLNWSSDSDNE